MFLSSDDLSESFVLTFSRLLTDRYTGHWDPNYPILGNGYRSVSVYNGKLDSVLKATSNALGLSTDLFASMLPFNFVLWVDPMVRLVLLKVKEVSFRKGDYGYPSVIWRQKHAITFRPKRASPLRTISLKQRDIEVSEPEPDSPSTAYANFERNK
jgi:hypothetical protein